MGIRRLLTLRHALTDPTWLGEMLGGESFTVMRTLLIAAMGEPLTPDEMPIFTQLTQRTETPSDNITADTIALKNCIDIQIRPASFRTIRGITAIAAIAEECSFWQSDDSRNPDKEILAAIRPAMATTGGTLFAIGSPHARKGETWATFRKHFGPDGNPAILVANGPTRTFNPTVKQSVIDRAYEDDPAVAASDWGGQFRSDLESYVSPEVVDA